MVFLLLFAMLPLLLGKVLDPDHIALLSHLDPIGQLGNRKGPHCQEMSRAYPCVSAHMHAYACTVLMDTSVPTLCLNGFGLSRVLHGIAVYNVQRLACPSAKRIAAACLHPRRVHPPFAEQGIVPQWRADQHWSC